MTRYEKFLYAYLFNEAVFNGEIINKPVAPFQQECYQLAEKERLLAVACPVRFGKSAMFSFVIPLTESVLQLTNKILLISFGSERAESFLNDIKNTIETNVLIRNDFGEVEKHTWRTDKIIFKFPKLVDKGWFEIDAKGWESGIRGAGYNLIIPDDIENDEEVKSEDRRVAKKDWFNATLFGRLEPNARLFMPGTLIHPLSLLSWVIEDPEKKFTAFAKRKFGAWDTDGHSIWKERWSDKELEFKRSNMSSKAVASELLNEPIHMESMKVRPEWLPVYSPKDRPEDLYVVSALDPAVYEREARHRDFDGIVTVGMEKGKKNPNFFVLSTIRGHLSPDDKVKALIDQRLTYLSRDLLIETTQSQQIIKDMVEKEKVRQNLYANVVGMKPYKDKGVRLEEVIPYFEQGRVFLNPNMLRLRDELVMFPNGDHDDLVDALVMCLSHLQKRLKVMSYQSNIQTKTYPTLVPDPVTGRLR